MGLLGGPKGGPEPAAAKSPAAGPLPGDRAGELFAAGVTCLCCEAWGEAYACFAETGRRDAPTLYNMALCCFGVAWYEECHRLVCEAERMLPPDGKPQPKGTLGSAEQGGSPGGELPEPFRRREAADGPPRCPMPGGLPRNRARTLLLRLRAEAAARLGRREEVRAIAARLGNRYGHIEAWIKKFDR